MITLIEVGVFLVVAARALLPGFKARRSIGHSK